MEFKDRHGEVKTVACNGKMYVEHDHLLGETLTCMDCGFMTAPGYGINKDKMRPAAHNGVKLN